MGKDIVADFRSPSSKVLKEVVINQSLWVPSILFYFEKLFQKNASQRTFKPKSL